MVVFNFRADRVIELSKVRGAVLLRSSLGGASLAAPERARAEQAVARLEKGAGRHLTE